MGVTFETGDIVECILVDDQGCSLELGKLYIVESVSMWETDGHQYLVKVVGEAGWWWDNRFRLKDSFKRDLFGNPI